ncbi:MAG: gliding motility-associated C-terminal domain-containing protein [Bacteroidia bacterium]
MTFKVLHILKPWLKLASVSILLLNSFILSAQFIENKGQLDSKILYTKPIFSGNLLVSEQGISYLFYDNAKFQELFEKYHHVKEAPLFKKQTNEPLNLKYHSVEQQFVGGQIQVSNIKSSLELSYKYNYFLGNDKSKWASNVRSFNKLIVKDLYPNIDLELLSGGAELKYNFICHPGSDPSQIKIKYNGAETLQLENNSLKIKTSIIEYSETIPVSYIITKTNSSETILVEMKLTGNILSFTNIPADFINSNSTLVIDPKLIFSTYSGTTADNFGFTATYDDLGNLYSGGITTEAYAQIPNGKYPVTPGAFGQTYNGGQEEHKNQAYFFPCDITISKYSPDGKKLLYATYIGGGDNEYPHSIVVDRDYNLVILGSTFSLNYPVTTNAYSSFNNGEADIVLTKLSATGSALVGSTYYGGTESDGLNESNTTRYFYADNFRGDVICDSDGSMLAAISTFSDDIEIKNGFKNSNLNKLQQGLVFKFSPDASSLVWSSYVGGDKNSSLYSIDFDKNRDIYVSGGTGGAGLSSTSGTINPNFKGGRADGYIAKISKDGKTLLKATYFGSDRFDQIISLELDDQDRVYVVGQTDGIIPVVGSVYNTGNTGQFLTMLNHDLTSIIYSATFGAGDGRPDITLNAFMVAECNRVFISGWGGQSSGVASSTTNNLPITSDAYQKTTDGSDFYIIVFSKELKSLLYATYFGGYATWDHVDGGTSRFDKKGVIYQSVCSSCPMLPGQVGPISDFPTSDSAFAPKNLSPRCSNAAFKFALENLNLRPRLKDTFFTIRAFDTLLFDYTINDPDDDTLNVVFTSLQNIGNTFLKFPKTDYGVGKTLSKFAWSPGCQHVGMDTFLIRADVHDRGCPDFKSNTGFIKILVTPPPVLPPPETVCLVFNKNDEINLSWSAIPASKFFSYTVLYKIFPDGKTVVVDSFRTTLEGKYLDKNVSDPRNKNYSYYLKVVNLCQVGGALSYKVTSVQESLSPVKPTKVITTTVVANKDVSIHWLPSQEPDFGTYSIYRSLNTPTLNFEYVKDFGNRGDTFYVDNTVDVQTQSYCYSLVVHDKCGLSSLKSNVGCNIVLSGISKPFFHVLDWQPYRQWDAGVMNYSLERCVDTGSLRSIVSVDANELTYDDHALDYDWGGYWYSVVAHENFKGYLATSRSNSIYLIQPPLLHVPNAFTKNKDQLNETWGFVPVFVKTYHMQVFNRWGEKVFDSEDKHQDWDGNHMEETKGIEVFIWQVTYTGWDRSSHYQKGTVTVIK